MNRSRLCLAKLQTQRLDLMAMIVQCTAQWREEGIIQRALVTCDTFTNLNAEEEELQVDASS